MGIFCPIFKAEISCFLSPPFDKKLWQRNYWEHIIRDDKEHQGLEQYIIDNPEKWAEDRLNDVADNQTNATTTSQPEPTT